VSVQIHIVDDHEVLREGVKSLLAKLRPDWQISGEANDGEQAIQLAKQSVPDVIILDISMPGVSGLEACSRMRKMGRRVPVLIFTTHQSERLAQDVRQVDAQGYVLKSQAARDLVLAIDTILAGGTFFGALSESQPSISVRSNPRILFRLAFAT
jgi:DNA-binding NarL/FixJ family response regulator